MTIRNALTLSILVISTGVASLGAVSEPGAQETHLNLDELSWQKTPIGPEASPVQGDFTKGAHVTYLRFAAGFKTPAHHHSADYVGIVLTGRMRHAVPSQPETQKVLASGAHWSMPAGVVHTSECLAGEDCVLLVKQDHAFDFVAH